MKHLKKLGFVVVLATSFVAVLGASAASATVLCKNNTSTSSCSERLPAGATLDFSLKGSFVYETLGGTTIDTCGGSTLRAKTVNSGNATKTIKAPISEWTWSGCTFPTATISLGELEIHHVAGTDNGTVTLKGTEITFNLGAWGPCTYGGGAGVHIGTLTGGSPASLKYNAIMPLVKNESGLCPAEERWTLEFAVTEPKPLYIASS